MTTNTAEATSGTKDPNDRYEKEEKNMTNVIPNHNFVRFLVI